MVNAFFNRFKNKEPKGSHDQDPDGLEQLVDRRTSNLDSNALVNGIEPDPIMDAVLDSMFEPWEGERKATPRIRKNTDKNQKN